MSKIRFCIVGCGRISDRHMAALKELSADCTIEAVCDTDQSALDKAQQMTGARLTFSNYEEMLKSPDIDAVSLCTPSGLHAEQACQAARAKKHVVTEKPMATRLEDGQRMFDECKKNQVSLFVVKQNRLNPTVQELKKAIDQGRFGKIYLVNCNVFWCRPQSYYDQAPWRGTWALDGGAYMNQASHYVDLLRWLIGPLESVCALTSTLARKIEAEDTGVVALKWKSGALGSMNVTMLMHDKNYEGSITVIGEKGTVRLGGLAANQILTWEFSDNKPGEAEEMAKKSYEISSVYGNSHFPFYQNVIATLKGHTKAFVTGEDGLQSLSLLSAIYKSAKNGVVVHEELL